LPHSSLKYLQMGPSLRRVRLYFNYLEIQQELRHFEPMTLFDEDPFLLLAALLIPSLAQTAQEFNVDDRLYNTIALSMI
jgi:hypothetical protein